MTGKRRQGSPSRRARERRRLRDAPRPQAGDPPPTPQNPATPDEAIGEREAERAAARICDLILELLNRLGLEHISSGDVNAASSALTSITSSVPAVEEAGMGFLGGVQEETRQWLLRQLRSILETAMQRVTNPKTPAPDRIKWSRIVIAAGQALNAILRDVELDALKQQINELKRLTLEKLSEDEQEEDRTRYPETSTSD